VQICQKSPMHKVSLGILEAALGPLPMSKQFISRI